MSEFDVLYNKLIESMTSSVLGTPVNGVEIGSTGGAVGVNHDKAYGENDVRLPNILFTKIQKRPTIKNRKNKKSK